MIIYFNSHYGPYGYLSNLAPYDIDVNGHNWRTVEHYFQAQKFAGTPLADLIRKLRKPQDVKRIGSELPWPVRSDWDDVQEEIGQRMLSTKHAGEHALHLSGLTAGPERGGRYCEQCTDEEARTPTDTHLAIRNVAARQRT